MTEVMDDSLQNPSQLKAEFQGEIDMKENVEDLNLKQPSTF